MLIFIVNLYVFRRIYCMIVTYIDDLIRQLDYCVQDILHRCCLSRHNDTQSSPISH